MVSEATADALLCCWDEIRREKKRKMVHVRVYELIESNIPTYPDKYEHEDHPLLNE